MIFINNELNAITLANVKDSVMISRRIYCEQKKEEEHK